MRLLQKLILVLYAISIFIITFAYVPYICYFEDGMRKFGGHGIRRKVGTLIQMEGTSIRGFCEFDSSLMAVELCTITLMTVAAILFLQKKKP